jgi:hypothetical protein
MQGEVSAMWDHLEFKEKVYQVKTVYKVKYMEFTA